MEGKEKGGILKNAPTQQKAQEEIGGKDGVTFDEEVIAEHDQERGTRQKIVEPKTPYEEEEQQMEEEEEKMEIDSKQAVVDENLQQHLSEAEKNKQINAQLSQHDQALHLELQNKLQETHSQQMEKDKSKFLGLIGIEHEEFEKKRKAHYKNEFSPAMLLKNKMTDEEEDEDQ